MQCISCQIDIPPAWKGCIIQNSCPSCMGPIMDQSGVDLRKELSEAMSKMANDPDGLAGWLLSNYVLTKIGDAQPTEFHGKKLTLPQSPNKIKSEKEKKIEEFMVRSGVDPSKIKKSTGLNSVQDIIEDIHGEDDQEIMEVEAEVMPQLPARGKVKPSMILDPNVHVDINDLEAIAQMADSAGSIKESTPALDLANSPLLAKERMKKLMKQQNALEGGAGNPMALRRAG